MKPLKITDRTTRALMIVTGLFLFTYVLLRAYLLSFTWDEAYTYLYFVRDHAWLPYEFTTMAANDHLLNTWLMKCCAILFGNSEFSLRLPNVLFFLVYLYFSFRIAFCFSNPVHRLCAFLLLCLNPYQLDFFGAARGYGMSFALLSGALYFTLTYFTRQRNVLRALAALLLSMLAVLANLSLLIFLLTLASIFALSIIRHHFSERRMLKTIVQLFIVLAPVLVFVLRSLPYIFRLRDCGALFYGGEKDIFTDTFLTLAHCTLYGFYGSRFMAPVLACGFVALIATGGILASRFLLKRELKGEKAFVASLAVLLLACALGSMLQFYVLHTKFLQTRTALFFYPMMALLFVHLAVLFPKRKWVIGSITLLAMIDFIHAFNFIYLYEWQECAYVKNIAQRLVSYRTKSPGVNSLLCTELYYETSIDYYRARDGLTDLNVAALHDTMADLFIVSKSARHLYENVHELETLPDSTFVLERVGLEKYRSVFDTIEHFEKQQGPFEGKYRGEGYRDGFSTYVDKERMYSGGLDVSLKNADPSIVHVSAKAMIKALEKYFDARCVISFEHPGGQVYSWQCCNVRDFVSNPGEWKELRFSCEFPREAGAQDRVKVYLWNFGDSPLMMDELEVRFIALH